MNKIIPIILAVAMPLIGISLMYMMFGGIKQTAVQNEVRRSQNPSNLMLSINDTESRIRRLEQERLKVQAIIDTKEVGYVSATTGNAIKLHNVGDLFADRNFNIDDVKAKQKSIHVQLYGSFWETIYPECIGWDHTEWYKYTIRWDNRKESAKGIEWAREVETNGFFKEGYYPYEEGKYANLSRLNNELSNLRSMDNGFRREGKSNASIGNPHAVKDSSIGAP